MRRILTIIVSLALIGGSATAAQALVPEHWGSVKGHVRSFGDKPIAKAAVYVYDARDIDNEPWIGTTSKTGRFELALPAGTYQLSAFDSGTRYAPSAKATTFTVTSKKATRVNKRLYNGAQISGRVYDGSGSRLAGLDVSVYSDPADAPLYSSDSDQTDATGAFHIGQLNPGTYYVYYRDPRERNQRWVAEWYSDAPTAALATTITVTAGKKATGVSATLAATP